MLSALFCAWEGVSICHCMYLQAQCTCPALCLHRDLNRGAWAFLKRGCNLLAVLDRQCWMP